MIPLFQGLKLGIFWISVDFQRLNSVQKRFQVFEDLDFPAATVLF